MALNGEGGGDLIGSTGAPVALCDFVNQAAVSKVWAGNIMNDVWMMYG
jgi:hypothetical protein